MDVSYLDDYQRRRKKNNKKNVKIPTPVIYLLLLAVGLYFFIHSPFFALKKITVVGNSSLETEKILTLSQLKPGQNLMKINGDAVVERVSVHPLIKEVNIKRKLPNTLEIIIEERKPVCLLVSPDGFIQVSAEGHFLTLVNDIGEYSLPVISGIGLEQIPGPGQLIKNQALTMALSIIDESEPELLHNLVEINIANEKHILAYTETGVEIRIGSFENIKEKMTNLREILGDFQKRGVDSESIEYIDLRFNGPPVIKSKK
ncbi:MAG: cell division protein FtsQ/DivIB [Bacillota bacterium]